MCGPPPTMLRRREPTTLVARGQWRGGALTRPPAEWLHRRPTPCRPQRGTTVKSSPFTSILNGLAEAIDHRIGWDKLPRPLALPVLIALRNKLREENLYDTGRGALDVPDISAHESHLTA